MKDLFKNVGPERIALIAVCGVVLLMTGMPWQKTELKQAQTEIKKDTAGASDENKINEEYISRQENRLKQVLETVEGVGKAEVMITLKSSGESVLNKDHSREKSTDDESGDQNSKSSDSLKEGEETILSDRSGNSSPYVIKQLAPEVSGVLIICEGAGSNRVASSVMQAAQAVYGISADRIKILKMEDNQ